MLAVSISKTWTKIAPCHAAPRAIRSGPLRRRVSRLRRSPSVERPHTHLAPVTPSELPTMSAERKGSAPLASSSGRADDERDRSWTLRAGARFDLRYRLFGRLGLATLLSCFARRSPRSSHAGARLRRWCCRARWWQPESRVVSSWRVVGDNYTTPQLPTPQGDQSSALQDGPTLSGRVPDNLGDDSLELERFLNHRIVLLAKVSGLPEDA